MCDSNSLATYALYKCVFTDCLTVYVLIDRPINMQKAFVQNMMGILIIEKVLGIIGRRWSTVQWSVYAGAGGDLSASNQLAGVSPAFSACWTSTGRLCCTSRTHRHHARWRQASVWRTHRTIANQRTQRIYELTNLRQLQPIGTELSSCQLNSSF